MVIRRNSLSQANPPPPTHFPYQHPIKTQSHFEQIPYTLNNVQSPMGLLEEVPSITLEGDWLLEAGFESKAEVVVTVWQGLLEIRMSRG